MSGFACILEHNQFAYGSEGHKPDNQLILSTIFTYDCFLSFLLAQPDYIVDYPKSGSLKRKRTQPGYWQIIPVLLRCNKTMRAQIFQKLRGPFGTIMKICRETGHTRNRDQIILTKLYKSGVLPDYVRYKNATNYIAPVHHMELSKMELRCVTDWNFCCESLKSIQNPQTNKNGKTGWNMLISGLLFTDHQTPGTAPSELCYNLENFGPTPEAPFENHDGTIKTYIDQTGSLIYLTADRFGDTFIGHPVTDLPLRRSDLNTYILILKHSRQSPVLLERFHNMFAPGITNISPTYNWDMLMFCALFDLDLQTLTSGLGRPHDPGCPTQNDTRINPSTDGEGFEHMHCIGK